MSPTPNEPFPDNRKPEGERHSLENQGIYQSNDLFQGRSEITICHHGEFYRLRITKSGKLILNK